jgi:hypothetical protein
MRIHSDQNSHESRDVVHLDVFSAYQRSFIRVKIISSVQNDTLSQTEYP